MTTCVDVVEVEVAVDVIVVESDVDVLVVEQCVDEVVVEQADLDVVVVENLSDVVVVESDDTEVVLVETGPAGPAGPAGPPGSGATVTRTAAVNLSGHRVVVPDDAGELIYADNATVAHLERPMWLTIAAIVAGAEGEVVALGEVTEGSWSWTPGQNLFLGANGAMTHTAPDVPAVFSRKVAAAITPSVIDFDPDPPIVLVA